MADSLTLVSLVGGDLFGRGLHLQQQLDSLDGRHSSLGDRRGNATSGEILHETHRIE